MFLSGAAGGAGGVAALKYLAPGFFAPQSATAFAIPDAGPLSATQPAAPAKPSVSTGPAAPPPPVARTTGAKPVPPPVANPFDNAGDADARRNSLRSHLMTLRSQLELYKLQHEDRLPDFSKYAAWHQLTRKTRADGTPAADGQFGPYLQRAPVNPLNNSASIGLVRRDVEPGQVMKGEKLGFVVSTISGKVWATDADGKTIFDELPPKRDSTPRPQYVPRTAEGKAASLRSQLQTLRAQIELYKLQHADLPPDFARHPGWDGLTRRTRSDGSFDPRGFGPYLDQPPFNPLNGHTKVEAVRTLSSATRAKAKDTGYLFETSTGRLVATDATGGVWAE
jgi:general secretion pathway protein G